MDTVRASRLMTTVRHTPTDTLCNTIRDMNNWRPSGDHLQPLNAIIVQATQVLRDGGPRSLRSFLLLSCLFQTDYSILHIYFTITFNALRLTVLQQNVAELYCKPVWGVLTDDNRIICIIPKRGSKRQTSAFRVKLAALRVFRKPHQCLRPTCESLTVVEEKNGQLLLFSVFFLHRATTP